LLLLLLLLFAETYRGAP